MSNKKPHSMDAHGQFVIACSNVQDRNTWAEVMRHRSARLIFVSTVADIRAVVRRQVPTCVICEEQLSDGSYREVLRALSNSNPSVRLLVLIQDPSKYSEVVEQGVFEAIVTPLRRSDAQWAVIRALTSGMAGSN